jgi:Arc/MetJ-type ribon-helix-helix transcriptional regulator
MSNERDREENKEKLNKLKAALIEGEMSGASQPFDFDDFIASKSRDAECD